MRTTATTVRAFFNRYAALFNRALEPSNRVRVEDVSQSFADYLVGANPKGVAGGTKGWLFHRMLMRGFARYRKLGMRSVRIQRVKTVPIDPLHVQAFVRWDSRYIHPKTRKPIAIAFTNVYFLQQRRGRLKIFAFVTGDESATLKKRGLPS